MPSSVPDPPEDNNLEPKAPDKIVLELPLETHSDIPLNEEFQPLNIANKQPEKKDSEKNAPESEGVKRLDDGELKALLEEAMAYRGNKNRDGKSALFKELLHEAEKDENSQEVKMRKNFGAKKKHSRHYKDSTSAAGGSLQNLHSIGAEGSSRAGTTRGRSRGRGNDAVMESDNLVSARQREGGSLPTNVNDLGCFTSRASLEVGNPSQEEDRPQPIGAEKGPVANGIDPLMTFTASSAKDVVEDRPKELTALSASVVESGSVIYTPTPVQHVSMLNIPPTQMHSSSEPVNRLGLNLSENRRPLDENENALRMDSFDKKKRRVKTKNDRNVVTLKLDEIEGYRGGADIEELVQYIEPSSNQDKRGRQKTNQANGTKNSHQMRVHHQDDSKALKRRREKRCTSLEEISKSKLEDLTEESSNELMNGSGSSMRKKQMTVDDTQVGKKSAWDSDAALKNNASAATKKKKDTKVERASQENSLDSEFRVVTKKKGKKKRRHVSGSVATKQDVYGGKGFPAHDRTLQQESQLLKRGNRQPSKSRRKSTGTSSVPPSESEDSSDLDSVHSLPLPKSSKHPVAAKSSVSGGSTPQASYADITKSPPPPTTDSKCDDRDEYPPLRAFYRDNNNVKPTLTVTHKSLTQPAVINVPSNRNDAVGQTSNVVQQSQLPHYHNTERQQSASAKRPAVILVSNRSTSNSAMAGWTFGGEVNAELLREDSVTENQEHKNSAKVYKSYYNYPTEIMVEMARYLQEHFDAAEEKVRRGKGARYFCDDAPL